jgi:hypothetical protein
MTPAFVLAILVASGEAQSAPTLAMAAAAGEVVGDQGGVKVVEASAPSDAEALRVERALGVRAVVALAWSDAEHRRAHLRLHAARTDRWIDRELDFAPEDTPSERGRALGFAMASMLPEGDPTLPLATTLAPAEPSPPPARLGANAVEAAFLAGTGAGGPAGGLGPRLGIDRFVASGLSFGLSLSSRWGRIGALDVDEMTSSAGLGVGLWPFAPTAERRLGVGVRAEALLLREAVTHTDAAGATRSKSDLVPGGGLALAATWRLAGALELVASGGAELAFGTIDVTVLAAPPAGGNARIPVTRVVGWGGLRARF